ncbi:MAG: SCO2524 family protein [Pseudonocardiaceae bacterium]
MKIQPRQQLLQIWRATVRASFRDRKWEWGGREGRNSISDAEQLLCILHPATELDAFRLETPDDTAQEILDALHVLGDSLEIPQLLIKVLTEYMEQYTDDAGAPIFSGASYFDPPESGAPLSLGQEKLDVVDSFSMSITLTLAALGFIQVLRGVVRREDLRQEVDKLERLSNIRLTAAMVGLLRSFSVRVFDVNSEAGRILCDRSNPSRLPVRQIVPELQFELRRIRSGLRDLTIGSGQADDLDSPSRLFECGWSWGIVKGAAPIELQEEETREKIAQPGGVAEDRPFLYFTSVALDGIVDLFSTRTLTLGLLSEKQRDLSRSLQLRWEYTQRYWSTIATFGAGRWPLEDLPWRTSDGQESDYYSLQVSSIVVQEMERSRRSDADLGRVGRVLEDLANRGRINRRPVRDDPVLEQLHAPGVRFQLHGSEEAGDHKIGWLVSSFASLLLKRTLMIARLVRDTDVRASLVTLSDSVWDHLLTRRLKDGDGQDLWDQPGDAFDQLSTHHELPSWYHTERVVECLVAAANVVNLAPLRSGRLTEIATDLLYEAEHLFDRELLSGSGEAGSMRAVVQMVRANLRRAWAILDNRPGTAAVLANEVLRDLERLAVARQDVAGRT